MVADDFRAPSCPHIVVQTQWLGFTHGRKEHRAANELAVEGQIHRRHGEQGPLHAIHEKDTTLIQHSAAGKVSSENRIDVTIEVIYFSVSS